MCSWAPHSFLRNAINAGINREIADSLVDQGNKIHGKHAAVIFTLRHLAHESGVKYGFLRLVVGRSIDPYRIFSIRKRSGGKREIAVPDVQLMEVQKWINDHILRNQPVSKISTAFSPGSSPKENASRHCGAQWLVKVDVRDFFPSISERQVYRIFRNLEYPALLAFELTRICTRLHSSGGMHPERRWQGNSKTYLITKYDNDRVGCLPQGAPTSPMLANLACLDLDRRLTRIASKYGGIMTRYADDIVFSSNEFDRVRSMSLINEIKAELGKMGLRENASKTAITPPGARRIVTGLLVDSDVPRLTRGFRDNLRMHLYHAKTKGLAAHCSARKFRSLVGFRAHIGGLIAYAKSIDSTFAKQCEADFQKIDWGALTDF